MAKIKTKTHSGAKKRFKMTASGKVKVSEDQQETQTDSEGHQAEENRSYRRYR